MMSHQTPIIKDKINEKHDFSKVEALMNLPTDSQSAVAKGIFYDFLIADESIDEEAILSSICKVQFPAKETSASQAMALKEEIKKNIDSSAEKFQTSFEILRDKMSVLQACANGDEGTLTQIALEVTDDEPKDDIGEPKHLILHQKINSLIDDFDIISDANSWSLVQQYLHMAETGMVPRLI
jgi:hypothetical protein